MLMTVIGTLAIVAMLALFAAMIWSTAVTLQAGGPPRRGDQGDDRGRRETGGRPASDRVAA